MWFTCTCVYLFRAHSGVVHVYSPLILHILSHLIKGFFIRTCSTSRLAWGIHTHVRTEHFSMLKGLIGLRTCTYMYMSSIHDHTSCWPLHSVDLMNSRQEQSSSATVWWPHCPVSFPCSPSPVLLPASTGSSASCRPWPSSHVTITWSCGKVSPCWLD